MKNKKIIFLFYITILSCFFVVWCEEIIQIPTLTTWVSYVDEFFTIGIFIYVFLRKKRLKNIKLLYVIILFSIIGLLSSYFSFGVNYISFLGAFNTIKPLLLYWSFENIVFSTRDVNYLFKLLHPLFYFILIFEIVDILIPSFRSNIGFIGHVSENRMGFRSIAGIMPRFTMITIMGVLYFYIYGYYYKISKRKQIISSIFILFSLRVKDIIAFLTTLLFAYNKKIHKKALMSIILACFFWHYT